MDNFVAAAVVGIAKIVQFFFFFSTLRPIIKRKTIIKLMSIRASDPRKSINFYMTFNETAFSSSDFMMATMRQHSRSNHTINSLTSLSAIQVFYWFLAIFLYCVILVHTIFYF